MATLASKFKDDNEMNNINNKVQTKISLSVNQFDEALDFFRNTVTSEDRFIYHHIGIYAFTKEALLRHVSLKRTKKELDRNLEQLRQLKIIRKFMLVHTISTFKCRYRRRFSNRSKINEIV